MVPEELGKIPDLLPRFVGNIPEFFLALVAYTVSTYTPSSGAHKDQLLTNLNIHFGVMLNELITKSKEDQVSGEEEKDMANK